MKDLPPILRSLRHRNFSLFLAGQGASLVGTWMQQVAMSWLVYRLTGSAFLLGVVVFCNQIPTFLFSSFAGVLADKYNRRRILIVTQILSLIQALILGILTLTGVVTVAHILTLGIFLGLVNALDLPTRQAFLMDMIQDKADIGNAIALNSSLVNAARLIGPSLAGILIAWVGEAVCFLINAVSYTGVVAALLAITIRHTPNLNLETNVWRNWTEGLRYAARSTPIGAILALLSVVSMMGMSFMVLMPVFVSQVFLGGPRMLGFLMAASGIGALAGTLYLATRSTVLGLGRVVAYCAALLGVALMGFSHSSHLWLSFIFILMAGFGMIVHMAGSNTILQTIVEDDKRGRVMSLYATAFMGMAPIGGLWAGWLAGKFGAPMAVLVSGLLCLLGAVFFFRKLPSVRTAIRPIYIEKGILQPGPLDT